MGKLFDPLVSEYFTTVILDIMIFTFILKKLAPIQFCHKTFLFVSLQWDKIDFTGLRFRLLKVPTMKFEI